MEALRAQREEDGIRLFEVLDVEKVFTQIIFSRDMIRYVSRMLVIPNGILIWGRIRVVRTWHTLTTRLSRSSNEGITHRKAERVETQPSFASSQLSICARTPFLSFLHVYYLYASIFLYLSRRTLHGEKNGR
jgi:hypothetical protein